ncbi:hypothetical protein [Streptomyces sp. NPDC051572]|uniref:hypothetical protein n=1 Tax=Streptomyces sp. NPDC051572 TaxID=3155802 RepID=UPI00344E791F
MQATIATVTALETTAVLHPMSTDQIGDWDFVTEGLRGVGQVRGFTVSHPETGELGVILQKGRDCHAECKLTSVDEYLYAGSGRTLRYTLAHILRARGAAGLPVPVGPEPIPAPPVPQEQRAVVTDGSEVYYTGSLTPLRGHRLIAEWCMCADDRGGWDLYAPHDDHVARHVRTKSLALAEGIVVASL